MAFYREYRLHGVTRWVPLDGKAGYEVRKGFWYRMPPQL